ncbi:MAG: hypothetical protein ACTSVB_08520 [Candidatus Heimdallarchaeaceae archaeon]
MPGNAFPKYYCLRENPFGKVPFEAGKLIWAECQKMKEQIETMLKRSLITSPSKIFVIYGDWGVGKTHSTIYFTQDEILSKIAEEVGMELPISLTLTLPYSQVFKSFYTRIVKEALPKVELKLKEMLGKGLRPKGYLKKLLIESFGITEDLAQVLIQIIRPEKKMAVKRYLYLDTTTKVKERVNAIRGIETISDMLDVITALFRILTFDIRSERFNKRIILWIDEGEHIDDLSGRDILELQTFLRALIDSIPRNLIVIINFSKKTPKELMDVLSYLGTAVIDRITDLIRIGELDLENAKEYIIDLLRYYRLEECNVEETFPFEAETIDFINEKLKNKLEKNQKSLNQRYLNDTYSTLLELILLYEKELLKKLEKKEARITKKIVEKYLEQILKKPTLLTEVSV